MYSPKKCREQLTRLYNLKHSRTKKVPMTQMVREAKEEYLNKNENKSGGKK
jgi:hypothetical protein